MKNTATPTSSSLPGSFNFLRFAYLSFLALALLSSCAKEITQELTTNDQAEAFMSGQHLDGSKSQSYFIKRLVQYPDARATEVVRKYSELSIANRGAGNWEAIHPAFSQAIGDWLNDKATRQDPGILGGIELTAYVYLTNYLFQVEAGPALAKTTAFYLKTLLDLGESAEWSILARALTMSQDALTADEYKTIARHIKKSATGILKNGADTSFSVEQQARQVEAAKQAIALLSENNKS